MALILVSLVVYRQCLVSWRYVTASTEAESGNANKKKVFGNKDPHSVIGYNISPGRQQLISSLMILGAFISSCAGGRTPTFLVR
jgi:hypothetical protein